MLFVYCPYLFNNKVIKKMDVLSEHGQLAYYLVEWGIPIALWLTVIGLALAFLFLIIYTIRDFIVNPVGTFKRLLGFIIFLVAIFVIYTMAGGEIPSTVQAAANKFNVTTWIMKCINTGLITAFFFTLFAFGAWILLELINLVR